MNQQPNGVQQRIPFARCRNCDMQFTKEQIEVVEIPADDDFEVGLNCPNCSLWFHFYFLNKELKDMLQGMTKVTNRRIRRSYQSKHTKFNKHKRKRLSMKKLNGRWYKPEVA